MSNFLEISLKSTNVNLRVVIDETTMITKVSRIHLLGKMNVLGAVKNL